MEIKNIDTGIVSTTNTGEDGSYSFALLPPGKYQTHRHKENFNTAVREGIQVRVADRLTLDVQLEIGVTAMVTTVASGLTLDTGNVNTGTVVTGKQISELPLTEGTAYQLATLAPGIAYTGNPLFTGPTSNGNLAAFRSTALPAPTRSRSRFAKLRFRRRRRLLSSVRRSAGIQSPNQHVRRAARLFGRSDRQRRSEERHQRLHGSAWYFNRDRSRTETTSSATRATSHGPSERITASAACSVDQCVAKIYNGTDRTFFLVSYERLKDNIAEPQIFTVPTEKCVAATSSELIVNRNNIAAAANTVIFNPFSGVQSGSNVVRRRSTVRLPAHWRPTPPATSFRQI